MAGKSDQQLLNVELTSGDWRLELLPARGGAIARLDWQGEPLLRPVCGPGILDTASFPLVPFSNRIAHGRFTADGAERRLPPNLPGAGHPHAIHGFGWQSPWQVVEADDRSAMLVHDWPGGDWPWPYRAEQRFVLGNAVLEITLSLTNLGETAMPAGLGFHPYFPRNDQTHYLGLHRGEWQVTADCLPLDLVEMPGARDWWAGKPVALRQVDTAYVGRAGALEITWPDRDLALRMEPSDNLPVTVVYTPLGEDYVCIEPVSHATDAINRGGMQMLAPGETMTCALRLLPRRLSDG